MKASLIVTGLSGLIGSRFRQLYSSQYDFRNLDLTTGVDITRSDVVDKAIKSSQSSVVVHLAAYTDVAGAAKQAGDPTGSCYQINVVGTKNIAETCRRYQKYLIFVSTDFVFAGDQETPYVETDRPGPIDWYGKTKYLAEKEIQNSLKHFCILRLAFPYLAFPTRPDLVQKIKTQLISKDLPSQFTDNFITPTFVDDFCSVLAAFIKRQPKGVYHAVGSSWHSSFAIAQLIKQTFNLKGEVSEGTVEKFTRATGRPFPIFLKMSNQKLFKEFGLKMRSFPQGLAEIKKQLT